MKELLYLDRGPEVVEAPGDDDVVIAADQGSDHGGAIAHSAEARVDLGMSLVLGNISPAFLFLSHSTRRKKTLHW